MALFTKVGYGETKGLAQEHTTGWPLMQGGSPGPWVPKATHVSRASGQGALLALRKFPLWDLQQPGYQ